MSSEWRARSISITWSNPLTWWWGLLALVSSANIAIWFLLYRQLHEPPGGSLSSGHERGLERRVLYWHWIIKDHHHAVASVSFKRAVVLDDDFADGGMVVAEQGHHVFCIGALGEAGEATQIAEESGNLSTMAFKLLLRAGDDNQIGCLWREKTPQPAHAFDFAHLVGDALFELLV